MWSVLSVLHSMCLGADAAARARAQRAAGAGGLEEVVAVMRAHAQDRSLQAVSAMALIAVCKGDDAAGRARKQRASVAGALEAVVEAMKAHPQAGLQAFGCEALLSVCGDGASGGWLAWGGRADEGTAGRVVKLVL